MDAQPHQIILDLMAGGVSFRCVLADDAAGGAVDAPAGMRVWRMIFVRKGKGFTVRVLMQVPPDPLIAVHLVAWICFVAHENYTIFLARTGEPAGERSRAAHDRLLSRKSKFRSVLGDDLYLAVCELATQQNAKGNGAT